MKEIAQAMEGEVKGQEGLLEELEKGVEGGVRRTGVLREGVRERGSGEGLGVREFCWVLWPLVLLGILIVGGVRRLIFG